MKTVLAGILLFSSLGSLAGCGRSDLLYLKKEVQSNENQKEFKIKEMTLVEEPTPVPTPTPTPTPTPPPAVAMIDMVWIIDNSGSMQSYQNQVIMNTDAFMKQFLKQGFSWKMGLISTSLNEPPYVGFKGTPKLDESVPSPVNVFTTAVKRLGTNGDGTERTFSPILKALKNDPMFSRPDVPIAFIMVTDAEEQSGLAAEKFIQELQGLLGQKKYFAYGVFAAKDLKCSSAEGPWLYKGSPYEKFINSASIGKVFPLCQDFGNTIASIGYQIATQIQVPTPVPPPPPPVITKVKIQHSVVYLTKRPKVSTLKVFYQGKPLLSGRKENGGWWIYDQSLNAVVFNSLAFSTNERDSVKIIFDEDVGQ